MTEWTKVTVDQLAAPGKNSLATGPFGSAISARYFTERGIPVIRGSNLSLDIGQRLIDLDLAFIPEELAAKFGRSRVRAGDLVFTCWGTVGQVGLIDSRSLYDEYIVSNKQMKLTPDPQLADSLFLYYAFSSPRFVEYLQGISIGSSVPGFNLGQLKSMELTLPSIAEQHAIASVLGALDDKLATNDRIAEVADELLRQHYVEVSQYSSSMIRIGDIGIQVRDIVSADSLVETENYIGLEHIPKRNVWLAEWKSAKSLVSAKSRFIRGDVLFGKLRPYFHKVGITFVDGVSSTDILVVRPLRDSYRSWLLASLSSDEVVAYASAVGDGTRMPRIKWSDLASHEIPWPGDEQAGRFNEVALPLANRVRAAVAENRLLAQLRNTLLPKLMSGQIRVRDAEKVVEDVT